MTSRAGNIAGRSGRIRVLLAATVLSCLAAGIARAAAPDPATLAPPPKGPQNINGVWFKGPGDPHRGAVRPNGNLPFTPEGLALYNQRRAMDNAGTPLRDPSSECMPGGLPRQLIGRQPIQIVQTPKETIFVVEQQRQNRIIHMNEKQVDPSKIPHTFMGHSVGHWEGDTLVVDTVGLHEAWTDWDGAPVSENVHIVERYKKNPDGQDLIDTATVEDPKYYSKPWTLTVDYEWAPESQIVEYVCEEGVDRLEPGWVWPNTNKQGG